MTDATSLKPYLGPYGGYGRILRPAGPGHRHPEAVGSGDVGSLGVVVASGSRDEILARAGMFQGVEPNAVSA
ncbi:MAG: hypothetical protein QOG05_1510, partial [Streptosporangiaceae bacterium]|nr:hypothetical protein [Streptosporangiaceae bacterium]